MDPSLARARLATAVPMDAAGQRLDAFVADFVAELDDPSLSSLSRSRIQRLIGENRLQLDDAKVKASTRLKGGEWLTLEVPEPEPLDLEPEPMALAVLFEDADIIAIDKPPGLVVHPGAGQRQGTLVHGLLAHCRDLSGIGGIARPGIVHRLDRDTSGVIVVAKNDVAHEHLARQFAERRTQKLYVAFVVGAPKAGRQTLSTLYGRHPRDRKRFSSRVQTGRTAVTHYEMSAQRDGVARLDVELGTGRTHQIRVHLADHGLPIVGDATYGPRRLTRVAPGAVRAAAARLERQALHARLLALEHPTRGDRLVLEAPLPTDLQPLAALLDGAG